MRRILVLFLLAYMKLNGAAAIKDKGSEIDPQEWYARKLEKFCETCSSCKDSLERTSDILRRYPGLVNHIWYTYKPHNPQAILGVSLLSSCMRSGNYKMIKEIWKYNPDINLRVGRPTKRGQIVACRQDEDIEKLLVENEGETPVFALLSGRTSLDLSELESLADMMFRKLVNFDLKDREGGNVYDYLQTFLLPYPQTNFRQRSLRSGDDKTSAVVQKIFCAMDKNLESQKAYNADRAACINVSLEECGLPMRDVGSIVASYAKPTFDDMVNAIPEIKRTQE